MSAGEGGERASRARGSDDRAGRVQGGEVLSSLPRRRPGRRSPRRDEARARAAAASERRSAGAPSAGDAQAGAGAGFGFQNLARASISIAAGTVGVGAKLAGGALGVIRGAVERR